MARLISETRLMWDMPITVTIVDPAFSPLPVAIAAGQNSRADFAVHPDPKPQSGMGELFSRIFSYFDYVDRKFSTFKPDSEISRINQGLLDVNQASPDMRQVLQLAGEMRRKTNGYFNIARGGRLDPLGLVKGWAISIAADMLRAAGCENFYVEAGGDFQAVGMNAHGQPWLVGIRSPFNPEEIVKVLSVTDRGVATSGTYIRGQHIHNPISGGLPDPEILSLTVIGPDVYQADCYATAAFAMGRRGIKFIEDLNGFEGYLIDSSQQATFTSGFERYIKDAHH